MGPMTLVMFVLCIGGSVAGVWIIVQALRGSAPRERTACPKCGKTSRSRASFCAKCGTSLPPRE